MIINEKKTLVLEKNKTKINRSRKGGSNDSKGTIRVVNAPIAALGADGSVVNSLIIFPDTAPTPVDASPGLDPARFNAP